MTVHHGDYYQALPGAPAPPPTDFDEPTPVPFLTTRGTFVGALEGPARWREVACQLLEAGLRDLGIGAKTASGYGRMKLSVEKTPIVRAREAALDALGNAFRGYQAGHRSKGIEVVVNALARDLDLQRVADALRPLAKDLRRSLLDGVREKMTDTTRLDALIALLTEVPSPVIVEAPRPAPAQVSAPATSRRRVRYRKDPKDPKRFFVEIEGDKERKGHTVAFGEGVLDRLRVAGDWLELTVTIDGNKPTITD